MSPVVMRTCELEAPHQLHCNGRGCHPAYGTDCAHLCPDAQLLGFCCLLCCSQLLVVGALLAAAGPDLRQPGHTLCFSYFYRLALYRNAVHASKRSGIPNIPTATGIHQIIAV